MDSQVVIVTGAASGIGAAIALSFAKLHANVCLADINEQELYKISAECRKVSKNKVFEVVADLKKDEDIENIIGCALKEFQKIDVLVNCAAIYARTNLEDSNIIEKYDEIFGVNLRSIVDLTRRALPALIESKGCVINISSVCSTIIVNDHLIYSMAKAGLTTFTKFAAYELAKYGVRVNCISPGPVKTNILQNAGFGDSESKELWNGIETATPLRKFVKAEEIAELAVYLASNNAASITGSDFVVDAGMMLGWSPDYLK